MQVGCRASMGAHGNPRFGLQPAHSDADDLVEPCGKPGSGIHEDFIAMQAHYSSFSPNAAAVVELLPSILEFGSSNNA